MIIAPLYPDVLPALTAWRALPKRLAIFSSGSVEAQLNFFKYVQADPSDPHALTRDLNPMFIGNFDTVTAGSKLEPGSYEKIARELGTVTGRVVFLTDNVLGRLCLFLSTSVVRQGIVLIFVQKPQQPPPQASTPSSSIGLVMRRSRRRCTRRILLLQSWGWSRFRCCSSLLFFPNTFLLQRYQPTTPRSYHLQQGGVLVTSVGCTNTGGTWVLVFPDPDCARCPCCVLCARWQGGSGVARSQCETRGQPYRAMKQVALMIEAGADEEGI